ncbi:MAG: hypothetical protein AAFX02_03790 [Pseudomonadota bacterium]
MPTQHPTESIDEFTERMLSEISALNLCASLLMDEVNETQRVKDAKGFVQLWIEDRYAAIEVANGTPVTAPTIVQELNR